MRNTGDGQWREWRWEGNAVPLCLPDPKQPKPVTYKPLTEVTHQAISMMHAKGALPQLRDAIKELTATTDIPAGGQLKEEQLRETIKNCLSQVLTADEMEMIFPTPPQPEEGGSRKPSKMKRGGSKLMPADERDTLASKLG
mmetsp:Transcript_28625/g.52090  ORF Transcript_28625/g.52090 Transcript_28625/m.52090 type:complete len:141 (-) Transcript_28625:62-484(-)